MIIQRVFLSCNDIECIRSSVPDYRPDEWFSTGRQARYAAKKDGWTRDGRQDFCPKHSKERSR